MPESVVNVVVSALFGLLIGVMVFVSTRLLSPRFVPKGDGPMPPAKPGQSWMTHVLEEGRRSAEEGRMAFSGAPRSGQVAMGVLYALVGMLIVVLKLSPVEMEWWWFLGALFAGFLLAQLTFSLARSGKIGGGARA